MGEDTGWHEEAVGEIAYYIDKFCTGGGENDFKAAELALDALVPSSLIPADLGREAWGLVDRALRGDDPKRWNPDARAFLARYEREVGE